MKSIEKQTHRNIEVIIVNDGSTDSTCSVVDVFLKKDSRFKLINQKNLGVSSARNTALEHASGTFTVFVDADDILLPNHISSLVEEKLRSHDSLVITNHYRKSTYLGIWKKAFSYEGKCVVYDKPSFLKTYKGLIRPYCWDKIFTTQIIKKNCIRFDPVLAYGEDIVFLLEYINYVDRFVVIDSPTYIYNTNLGTIGPLSSNGFSDAKNEEYFINILLRFKDSYMTYDIGYAESFDDLIFRQIWRRIYKISNSISRSTLEKIAMLDEIYNFISSKKMLRSYPPLGRLKNISLILTKMNLMGAAIMYNRMVFYINKFAYLLGSIPSDLKGQRKITFKQ